MSSAGGPSHNAVKLDLFYINIEFDLRFSAL